MAWTVPDVGTPQGIVQLGNAFGVAQVLLTAVELDLFMVLDDGPATVAEIRGRLELDGRGLHDCLQLLLALGLLDKEGDRYRNGPGAARHLVRGRDGYVGGLLLGAKTNLYPVWAGLTDTLRTGKPQSTADGFAAMLADPERLRAYAQMMEGALQPLVARLTTALDWSAYDSVLDVGGCRGKLVNELLLAHPRLTGQVLDLPPLWPLFDECAADHGTAARARFHAADFFTVPLPRADVVIFGHVLHNWRPDQRAHLVRKAFDAVNPGGVLLVHDRMLDDEWLNLDNLLGSLIMALVTEDGSEYAVHELVDEARAAGFTAVTRQPLDDNETLVICHKDR